MKHNFSHVWVRMACLFLLFAFLVSLAPPRPAAAQQARHYQAHQFQTGQFEQTECMFRRRTTTPLDDRVVCGYLTVPADHDNPNGPTIQLAVVVLKSTGSNPRPDPLVMAQGGPGGSTIDYYAEQMLDNPLRQERDIVLFDQRGTLYSKPVLYCKEIDDLTIQTLDQDLTLEQSEQLNLEAMRACHERLVNEGINLSDFNSVENANDIDTLRQVFGYDKINLYGVSYGTLLALHYMRQFPDTLRSVILDGVVPPQTNYNLTGAQTKDQAFTRLFEACRSDASCNAEYPNLEQVFFDVVDRLNETPARVTLTDTDTRKSYPNSVIDGDTFQWLVFQLLYISDFIPALPRMIYDAQKDDFTVASRILSVLAFDHTMSYGMYYSVVCAEDADFTPEEQDLSGVRPRVAEMEKRNPRALLDTCQAWNVNALGPQVDEPVKSDIPTLLFSGGFDPVTPASYAQEAASTLSNSYSFVFPAGGHGQLLEGDCQENIARAFLDNPGQAPDASCIQQHPAPEFYTNRTLIAMPDLLKMLNLDPSAAARFLLLIGGALFLLTAFLVFPIAWLANRLRRKPAAAAVSPESYPAAGSSPVGNDLSASWQAPDSPIYPPSPAEAPDVPLEPQIPSTWRRMSSWVALLQAVILALFLTALTAVIAQMVNNNDSRLFYGLGAEARPWFILPLVFGLLSLLMLAIMVMLWARREGSLGRRLYYSLLAITALVCTLVMGSLGMLTGLF